MASSTLEWLTVEHVRIDASKMRHVSELWMGNLDHDPLYCAVDRPFTVCYCWCKKCRDAQGLCTCPGCETWHPYDRNIPADQTVGDTDD